MSAQSALSPVASESESHWMSWESIDWANNKNPGIRHSKVFPPDILELHRGHHGACPAVNVSTAIGFPFFPL
ncbi:MAG TPA: hypothetical protein VHB49_05180 [Bradyrhizobium sp.]|nr:hypothetical protein [Bradyrhizobium sp.]